MWPERSLRQSYVSEVYTHMYACTHICAQIGYKRHFFRCSANKEIWLLATIRRAALRITSSNAQSVPNLMRTPKKNDATCTEAEVRVDDIKGEALLRALPTFLVSDTDIDIFNFKQ